MPALATLVAALAAFGVVAAGCGGAAEEPAPASDPLPADAPPVQPEDAAPGSEEAVPRSGARKKRAKAPADGSGLPTQAEQTAAIGRLVRLGFPVYCGGGKGNYVALTFDDGPGELTPKTLKILADNEVRATFFVAGVRVADNAQIVRREAAMGAVANHAWSHPDLTTLTAEEVRSQLTRTRRAIKEAQGQRAVRLLRPPYGARNPVVDREADRLGMLQILWSVDSADALGADFAGIAANVKAGLKPGAIILLHENRGQTLRALKFHIIPALQESGLTTVTVPELLALDPPSRRQLREGAQGCHR